MFLFILGKSLAPLDLSFLIWKLNNETYSILMVLQIRLIKNSLEFEAKHQLQASAAIV